MLFLLKVNYPPLMQVNRMYMICQNVFMYICVCVFVPINFDLANWGSHLYGICSDGLFLEINGASTDKNFGVLV